MAAANASLGDLRTWTHHVSRSTIHLWWTLWHGEIYYCVCSQINEFEAVFPSWYGIGLADTHTNLAFQFLYPHSNVKQVLILSTVRQSKWFRVPVASASRHATNVRQSDGSTKRWWNIHKLGQWFKWKFKYYFNSNDEGFKILNVKGNIPQNMPNRARIFLMSKRNGFLITGAFAKQQKATVSFIMTVRLSALKNSAPTGQIFMKFDIWVFFFENLSRKFKFHSKLARITGTLTFWRRIFFSNFSTPCI